MLEPTRRWTFPPRVALTDDMVEAGRRLGLARATVRLLASRGCRAPADLQAFVGDPVEALGDPALLPDATLLRDRVLAARAAGEPVMVFGDFDADGLTGLAILTTALRALGLAVEPYVPDRIDEGHGLSEKAVLAAGLAGANLIVTVDCGTSSRDEVAFASSRGIDVAITDHHHLPDELPAAIALVNPRRPDSAYPERHLTGAGVAFRIAEFLLRDTPAGRASSLALADLAAIGTIADVAPLLGENRAIVRLGLERIRDGARVGLRELLRVAGIPADRIDVDLIAYQLAPRINAAGRVGEAGTAARLLLADDPETAASAAAELEAANRSRRELTAAAVAEADLLVRREPDAPAIVVAGPWPVGLIGVMAGRLAEEWDRPAVVISSAVSPWRGSARAGDGFDLAATFAALRDHLGRYGGHAPAAGCDLRPGAYDAFRVDFLALAAERPIQREAALSIDLVLPATAIDYPLHRQLQFLEPTGPGNPTPLLAVMDATVVRTRPANGGHAQLTLSKGREVLDAIAFGRADLVDGVQPGDRLDIVARLESRTYAGLETLQLIVEDAATSGLHASHVQATRAAVAPGAVVAGSAP